MNNKEYNENNEIKAADPIKAASERKSHNRVHRENRDFDALFNAQIDEEKREERQRRLQKRRNRKTNPFFSAVVKLSKINVSKPRKNKEKEDILTDLPILHAENQELPATSAVKSEIPALAVPEISKPEVKSEMTALAVPEISKPEVKSEMTALAVPEISKPEVRSEIPALAASEISKPEMKSVKPISELTAFFSKATAAVKHFYEELTDKSDIDRLRLDTEDNFEMFADIKETLENTPVDSIDIQNRAEEQQEEIILEEVQIGFEIAEESVKLIEVSGESLPAVQVPNVQQEISDLLPEVMSSDAINACVTNLFDQNVFAAQERIEQFDEALIPEVSEAMKEIDFEYVMNVLETKSAGAVEKTDTFLDEFPNKIKQLVISRQGKWYLIPNTPFQFKKIHLPQNLLNPVRVVSHKTGVLIKSLSEKRKLRQAVRQEKKTVEGQNAFISALHCKRKSIWEKIANSAFSQRLSWLTGRVIGFFEKEKNLYISSGVSILIVGVFFGYAIYLDSITAYKVSYNQSFLGIVREKEDIINLVGEVEASLKQEYNMNIYINPKQDFSFTMIRERGLPILTKDQIFGKFSDISKINVMAYQLVVDEEPVVILSDRAEIENVMSEVKENYLANVDASAYDSISFTEDIQIEPVQVKMIQLSSAEEAKQLLLQGTTETKEHIVQPGETLSEIAKNYGIKTSEIQEANPEVDPKTLQIDQKISLIAPKPYVTLRTTEVKTYIAEIPFEITYEESGNLYKGETTVKTTGKTGEKRVTAEIVRKNGVEVSRTELSSEVLNDPVDQIVVKGSKALPLLLGTGSFQNPVRGTLSSRYGQRWSRTHQGIDIAAPRGTTIKAADGGTVTYAGYDGAYGNTVRINHGANKVTVYAHCSKLLVKNGQKVAKGQQIATVGTTGRTTGPHLHFEVKVNGKTKNPLEYVKY